MSRLCSHESAAAPLARVSEATLDAVLLSDNKGGMASSLKSSGRTEYWRHPWINLMPFAYQLAVREGERTPLPKQSSYTGKEPEHPRQKGLPAGKNDSSKVFLFPLNDRCAELYKTCCPCCSRAGWSVVAMPNRQPGQTVGLRWDWALQSQSGVGREMAS
jgi:hypothetical protein